MHGNKLNNDNNNDFWYNFIRQMSYEIHDHASPFPKIHNLERIFGIELNISPIVLLH